MSPETVNVVSTCNDWPSGAPGIIVMGLCIICGVVALAVAMMIIRDVLSRR